MIELIRKLTRLSGFDLIKNESLDYLKTTAAMYDAERTLCELLRARGIELVLDVGGNVGHYGIKLRQKGYAGELLSFEPAQAVFSQLERQAEADSRWTALPYGLGAENERLELNISENNASSSILEMETRHREAAPASKYTRTETIEIKTLDSLWSDLSGTHRSAFMKLDVQGFEKAVLEGAGDTLPKIDGLQLECSFVPLYKGESLFPELYAYLQEQGYALWAMTPTFIDPNTNQLLQVDAIFFREK